MENEQLKRVIIYIRVSTQEQAQEGYSIPAQKERLINYCKARGWIIVAIYIDPGYSGSNMKRPGLEELIANINNTDVVLVYKLDRLSRSQKDTLYLIEDVFLKNNVDFVSMNESFDTSTPFGRAMVGILSVFAQLERETIKERSIMGRIERAKYGLYHGGGVPPIGYDYIDGELVINDYEAIQVKEIISLYLSGMGIKKIITHMTQKGYTHRNGSWKHISAILSVLDSPVYTGKITFHDEIYVGKHEAIISEETYEQVQKIRKRKRDYFAKTGDSNAILTGMIWCGNCGARYAPRIAKKKYAYYSCYSRLKKSDDLIKDPTCMNANWKMEYLDDIVEKELFKIIADEDKLKKSLNPVKKVNNNSDSIKKEILSVEKQIKKLMDLYQFSDGVATEEVAKRLKTAHEQKTSLSTLLKQSELPEKPSNNHYPVLMDIKKNWNSFDINTKRTMLKLLIDKIIIHDDNNITITWSFI